MVYDLRQSDLIYELVRSRIESTSVQDLLQAFGGNPLVPPKAQFIERLERKAKQRVSLRLEMER
ncbi:MAG: hypothetical protein FJZ90_03610 [Chloroflexi bacterium]|nr:hypothetical protein [Chloroflexota bacterium]